jgi:hypothetical protein
VSRKCALEPGACLCLPGWSPASRAQLRAILLKVAMGCDDDGHTGARHFPMIVDSPGGTTFQTELWRARTVPRRMTSFIIEPDRL